VSVETGWKELQPQIKAELTGDMTRGNHVAVIAPTGGGKTTLVTKGILPLFDTNQDILLIDSTADPKLGSYGKPFPKYGKVSGLRRLTIGDMTPESIGKVHKAMNRAYRQGGVVVVFDEVRHITDGKYLGLSGAAESLWLFSRKRENLVVGLTQAPRYVPSAFYDQSKLHFIFRIRDKRAMLRLAEIGGDYETIKQVTPTLRKYEFAYVNSDGDVTTSKFDLPKQAEPRQDAPRLTLAVPAPRVKVRR
jgi:hypothetical protein